MIWKGDFPSSSLHCVEPGGPEVSECLCQQMRCNKNWPRKSCQTRRWGQNSESTKALLLQKRRKWELRCPKELLPASGTHGDPPTTSVPRLFLQSLPEAILCFSPCGWQSISLTSVCAGQFLSVLVQWGFLLPSHKPLPWQLGQPGGLPNDSLLPTAPCPQGSGTLSTPTIPFWRSYQICC